MSNKLTFLVSFVLVLGLAASMAKADITTDLIGYWPFEEGSGTTAADATGNGNDGTFNGNVEWVQGHLGGAVHFDDAGERIVVGPLDPTAANNAMTLAAWINWEGLGHSRSQQGIIGKRQGWDPGTGIKWFWQAQPGGVLLFRADWANGGGTGLWWGNTYLEPYANEWAHVALTWDNGAAIQYINAEEVSNGNITFQDTADATPVSIGCVSATNDEHFVGIIDEARIYSRALTAEDIVELFEYKGGPPVKAARPSPADGAADVPRDVVLNWKPGELAPPTNGHKVYFSEIFNDVNDGIGGFAQDANSYTPTQRLGFDTTYYWRVDEVNAPPDSTIFKGNIWSFTVEPFVYPIENVTATSSSFSVNMEPEKTVDGSGLNDSDQHSTDSMDMWLSSMMGPQPTWIQYEFDRAYKVYEMWVWNSNQTVEAFIGFGAKDVTIEYSEDGAAWTALGDMELARATGTADYTHNTTVDFGGALAKYVRINVHSNWGGITTQYGLSEVRFFQIPVYAREPKPASGSKSVARDVVLDWRAGREAASHEISISSDEEAVINGTAPVDVATESRYQPGTLDFGQTYYWKVNEVNEAASPSTWEGDVWNFSTTEYFVVEDFEDYNDYPPDEIFNTWIDGYGTTTNGSTAGYAEPDWNAGEHYVETTIVHGGAQSMPLFYDNNFKYSEAVMALVSARDWTVGGATKLSLWFRGEPNNAAEPMYVALNGSAVVYHDDPGAKQIARWTEWTIDLQEYAAQGVNLANVNTIAIGFGDKNNLRAGGSGMVFFDDIRVGHPVTAQAEIVNILANGGFEDGVIEPWDFWGDATAEVVTELVGAAVPETPIEGDSCLHMTVNSAGANFWDYGLNQGGHVFEAGKKYTLSAFLKCKEGTMDINFKPELAADPWSGYGEQAITMTDEWAEYSVTTPVFAEDTSPGSITFHIAFAAGEFWVDGVRFYEGDYVPPVGSPVGYWKLDDGAGTIAVDSSGNGNDGTLIGDPLWTTGVLDGALDFDGDGDYVDCGNDPLFDITGEITVAAWLNIRSIPNAWTGAVVKGENAWRLSNVNMDPRFHFGITIWSAPDTASVDGVTAVGYNEWHHVTGTFDGANINVYLDGVLDESAPTTEPLGISTTNLFIGENSESTGRSWDGLIDEVMIFDMALSADEILELASQ